MGRGRSGHSGSVTNVERALQLIKEVNEAAETFLTTHSGTLTPEQEAPFATVRASLQYLEGLRLAEQIAAVEQEIADNKVELERQIAAGKAALYEQFMEGIRLSNSIKGAHIYIELGQLEEKLAAATASLDAKEKELTALEVKAEALTATTYALEAKRQELATAEAGLAEVRVTIAKLQAQ